jgi:hypothetical protein
LPVLPKWAHDMLPEVLDSLHDNPNLPAEIQGQGYADMFSFLNSLI